MDPRRRNEAIDPIQKTITDNTLPRLASALRALAHYTWNSDDLERKAVCDELREHVRALGGAFTAKATPRVGTPFIAARGPRKVVSNVPSS